jgi:hypothetical protein
MMARINVAQFLESIVVDDALQEEFVGLGARRGFDFTREELVAAEPGATAAPKTWRKIAGFPDLGSLPGATETAGVKPATRVAWPSRAAILAASNVLLFGSLAWSVWRGSRARSR